MEKVWIVMASSGRNTVYKWPVSVYTDKNAAKQRVLHLRNLEPSLLQDAENRSYVVEAFPIHYYLARRQLVKTEADCPDVDIDSNAEDALEETYETTSFSRTYLPDLFRNGTYNVRNRPSKKHVIF